MDIGFIDSLKISVFCCCQKHIMNFLGLPYTSVWMVNIEISSVIQCAK